MEIVHRKGASHNNADSLFRRPFDEDSHLGSMEDPEDGNAFCSYINSSGNFNWNKLQMEDKDLKLVNDLKAQNDPLPYSKDGFSTTVKILLDQWETITIIDNILCRRFECDGGKTYNQIIVPSRLQKQIVKELHAGIGGGHLGEQKTSMKDKDRFYWPGWTTDVKIMCKECVVCATKKCPSKQSKALLVSIKTGASFEKVALDILGPLPATSRGNKFIMVISDYCSKWT